MKSKFLFLGVVMFLGLSTIVHPQGIAESVAEQESELSRIMKGAGTLLVRESHSLPKIPTTSGEDIECKIMVLKNLLAPETRGEDIAVGLVLSA